MTAVIYHNAKHAKKVAEMEIKKRHGSAVSLWQREKDSNPHIRSQSPLCYLYTIPLCSDEQKLLYRFHGVCQQFFSKDQEFICTPEFGGIYVGVAVHEGGALRGCKEGTFLR